MSHEMKLTTTEADALRKFADVWSDGNLHNDIGDRLTCHEADALAGALTALGDAEAGQGLLEAHAEGDEEGDAHYLSV